MLVQVCRDHGIEPVLITQPTLYGPGVDPVTGVDLEVVKVGDKNGRFMFQVLDLYNGVTRRVALKDGVLLIDLARELPRNSAYYYDYLHYTEPGAAEVARIIDAAALALSGGPLSLLQEIALRDLCKILRIPAPMLGIFPYFPYFPYFLYLP